MLLTLIYKKNLIKTEMWEILSEKGVCGWKKSYISIIVTVVAVATKNNYEAETK